MKLRRLLLGRKVMINLDSIVKSRDITLPTKVCLVKAMVFPVVMWELDCEKSWAPKNRCFWTVVLGKTLESPLDCKEIQPIHPKGDQSWLFIGRTDGKAEFGPLMQRADSFEKTLMLGKIEDRRRRGWQRMRWLDGIWTELNWFSPKLPSHPGCHITLRSIPVLYSRSLLVIHYPVLTISCTEVTFGDHWTH